jgi:pyridinium-3,5-bisthiocarboxylic acid mononucleotide nickel chelatase
MPVKYSDSLVMIETNIDDMNPEIFDAVMESLFKAGAHDVYFSSIIMKKSRPATKISVLAEKQKREILSKILLRETTSFGVRFYDVGRLTLEREMQKLKTAYGIIKIKIGSLDGEIVQATPEFEDCRNVARKNKIFVKKVYDDVLAMAQKKWLA